MGLLGGGLGEWLSHGQACHHPSPCWHGQQGVQIGLWVSVVHVAVGARRIKIVRGPLGPRVSEGADALSAVRDVLIGLV